MALLKNLKKIDQKFAWSFLGVLLALMFGSYTGYREYINSKPPSLQFDILTSTSVLDVRERLSNLSVLFDGIDIRKQGRALRVITVRVLNDSPKDILKGHFDDKAPLGLHISTGKIIKTELAEASNDYLRKKFTVGTKGDNTLLFPSFILEAREYFVLKLLILHPEGQIPSIEAIGKVAGIKTIRVREAFRDLGKEPFFTSAFGGNFLVQSTRLLPYTIVTILLIAAISFLIVTSLSALKKSKRKKVVKEFKSVTNVDLNELDEFIFTEYVKAGEARILGMRSKIEQAIEEYKPPRRRRIRRQRKA